MCPCPSFLHTNRLSWHQFRVRREQLTSHASGPYPSQVHRTHTERPVPILEDALELHEEVPSLFGGHPALTPGGCIDGLECPFPLVPTESSCPPVHPAIPQTIPLHVLVEHLEMHFGEHHPPNWTLVLVVSYDAIPTSPSRAP